ncbi:MAG: hypothetical protein ACI8YQ_002270 [Polaribacter sp.]|jgi:hypothetical protein
MKKQSLYTTSVESKTRSFYFDIKEAENGSNYLIISEVKTKNDGTTERRQIFIFENEIAQVASKVTSSLVNFTRKETTRDARIARAKQKYANAYEPWTKKEDADLALLFKQGNNTMTISEELQRQPGAITIRLEKLSLIATQAA